MADNSPLQDYAHLINVLPAWLEALGTNNLEVLRTRLSWDDDPKGQVNGLALFLSRLPQPGAFSQIQEWLLESTRIDESEPALAAHQPFADLWHRVALGAMSELAKRLPNQVVEHYQIATDHNVHCRKIRTDLVDDLTAKLSAVGEPLLWNEFNKSRTPSHVVMAYLGADGSGQGPPRRAIYCSFVERLRSDGLASLEREYPVFVRHLSTTVEHWLQHSCEILTRVSEDLDELRKTFGLPDDADLTGIRQSMSDPHRGGRSVAILSFTSDASSPGANFVVYKPKDLRLDHTFNTMLANLPLPRNTDEPLRSVSILVRLGYGYMEWVRHETCENDSELRAFYRNSGRLTAILHLLGGSDCHHENLIACKNQLLLIDAETLFEGIPADPLGSRGSYLDENGLYKQLGNSVIRLGLLPQWHFIGEQQLARDVSALGIETPRVPSQQEEGWVDLNSDGMRASKVEKASFLPTSSPVSIGSANRLGEFLDDFSDGFKGQLTLVAARKEEWLGTKGVLERFRPYKRRFVPRPTWLYAWLQKRQLEPAALQSELIQQITLENLARSYLLPSGKPDNWPLLNAEVFQMEVLDIPFFEHGVDDLELQTYQGKTVPVLETSGYENAYRKVQDLCLESIDLQCRIVRGVVTAKNMRTDHTVQVITGQSAPVAPSGLSEEERYLEAEMIGKLIVDTSISYHEGAVEWLGIDLADDAERSKYGPLGLSLYSGRSGIALFLAALAKRSGSTDDTYRRTALGAFSDLRKLYSAANTHYHLRWWRDQPLGLAGSGGIILALTHLRFVLPELKTEVTEGLSALIAALDLRLVQSDHRCDIIHGCAGLIGPLLKVGSPRALMLAEEAGKNLVRLQNPSGGWSSRGSGGKELTGFSHGASGIASALAVLNPYANRSSFLEAAAKALVFERQNLNLHDGRRPDHNHNEIPNSPRAMLGWCHGAPGVALSRILMSRSSLWDRSMQEELSHALTSTADLDRTGDSLCCGRFGRAAILRVEHRRRREAKWLEAACQIERQGLATSRKNGEYSFLDMLGLFTGRAGVGMALLDSINSEERSVLPSILSAGLIDG